jgi:hypothetical protein
MEDNYGAYREEVSNRRGRVPLILFASPHVREIALQSDTTHPSFNLFQYARFARGGLDRPIAVEGGLDGKTRPDFNCPIAIRGRAALDLDRPIVVEGRLEGRTGPDFDCPIAMAGIAALDLDRGLEGTFLGIPGMLCKFVSKSGLFNCSRSRRSSQQ